jgi:hypothetical protein
MEISCLAYCHDLGFWVTYRQVLDWMIGFIHTLYVQLITTDNYSAIIISTLQFTVTPSSVLGLVHSPLVVSWQWIHNSPTATTNHT